MNNSTLKGKTMTQENETPELEDEEDTEAAPAPGKKKSKRRAAYKYEQREGTCSTVEDAKSDLDDLASECREIVDNASEGLSQTERIQTFESTADTLENVSDISVPECLSDIPIHYTEAVNVNKRKGPSRAKRAENIASIYRAAAQAAQEALDEASPTWTDWAEYEAFEALSDAEKDERRAEPEFEEPAGMNEPDIKEEDESDIESFISDCESAADEIEGCEFPGMYG
jgi:hypothetical protein